MDGDTLFSIIATGGFALTVFLLGMWELSWSKRPRDERDR